MSFWFDLTKYNRKSIFINKTSGTTNASSHIFIIIKKILSYKVGLWYLVAEVIKLFIDCISAQWVVHWTEVYKLQRLQLLEYNLIEKKLIKPCTNKGSFDCQSEPKRKRSHQRHLWNLSFSNNELQNFWQHNNWIIIWLIHSNEDTFIK